MRPWVPSSACMHAPTHTQCLAILIPKLAHGLYARDRDNDEGIVSPVWFFQYHPVELHS